MAYRRSFMITKDSLLRPWIELPFFNEDNYLSRVPEFYKKFYYEWKYTTPSPVHYIPKEGTFEKTENGDIIPVQNTPLPLKIPKELHKGIWGGEAIIKGFVKKEGKRTERIARHWVPSVKSSVLYSEILDRYMTVAVTDRTLNLVDKHYGFDNYILETPPQDLMSELALKIKREMLLGLVRETIYPDNPAKKKEMLDKYKKHIIPEEEAEWYGLNLLEASNKQRQVEEKLNEPKPLKHQFRAEFVEYLKTVKKEDEEKQRLEKESGGLNPSEWLNRVNPFGKKKED